MNGRRQKKYFLFFHYVVIFSLHKFCKLMDGAVFTLYFLGHIFANL